MMRPSASFHGSVEKRVPARRAQLYGDGAPTLLVYETAGLVVLDPALAHLAPVVVLGHPVFCHSNE